MDRPLKIGLYSPFFGSTLGGGEKYLGVTAEAVRDAFPGHQVEIVTPVPVDTSLYERMLDLDLSGIRFISTNRRVTWLHRALNALPTLRLYRDLFIGGQAIEYTRAYDLFIAMVYVIPVFSLARHSVMLCQFPYNKAKHPTRLPRAIFDIYALPYRLLRAGRFPDDIGCFQEIICQSSYVRKWIAEYWKRDAAIINPPIDVPPAEPNWEAKAPIILSVGRFFRGGHAKRHDLMVGAFRELCDAGLTGWELHLAGSVHRQGQNAGYYESIVELARGYPIHLHPDAEYAQVQDLYRRASIYWHAAGYGADPRDPALLEHFGMTTAEAMGHGVVPVVIGSGGQPEVVQDGVDGLLWNDEPQLISATRRLIDDPNLRRRLAIEARRSAPRFSRAEFKRKMIESLKPILVELEATRPAPAGANHRNK